MLHFQHTGKSSQGEESAMKAFFDKYLSLALRTESITGHYCSIFFCVLKEISLQDSSRRDEEKTKIEEGGRKKSLVWCRQNETAV